jgi:hypothetical protein
LGGVHDAIVVSGEEEKIPKTNHNGILVDKCFSTILVGTRDSCFWLLRLFYCYISERWICIPLIYVWLASHLSITSSIGLNHEL